MNLGVGLFLLIALLPAQEVVPASARDPRTLTLTRRATQAKAEGKSEVIFSESAEWGGRFSRGFDDALSQFSCIVGIPREMRSIASDYSSIETWYSIEVEATLVQRAPVMRELLQPADLPAALKLSKLLPLPPGRMLLVRGGGSIQVDGVTLIQRDGPLSQLERDKRYLFIVDLSSEWIAMLPYGDAGVFTIDGEDGKLTPVSRRRHPITDEIKSRDYTLFEVRRRSAAIH